MHALQNSISLLEKCSQALSTEEVPLIILAQLNCSIRLLRCGVIGIFMIP